MEPNEKYFYLECSKCKGKGIFDLEINGESTDLVICEKCNGDGQFEIPINRNNHENTIKSNR